jgi:hypothetical protein
MIRKGALNIYRNKVNAYSHLLCARVMGVSSLDKEILQPFVLEEEIESG